MEPKQRQLIDLLLARIERLEKRVRDLEDRQTGIQRSRGRELLPGRCDLTID